MSKQMPKQMKIEFEIEKTLPSGATTVITRVNGIAMQRLYLTKDYGTVFRIDFLAGNNLAITRTESVYS